MLSDVFKSNLIKWIFPWAHILPWIPPLPKSPNSWNFPAAITVEWAWNDHARFRSLRPILRHQPNQESADISVLPLHYLLTAPFKALLDFYKTLSSISPTDSFLPFESSKSCIPAMMQCLHISNSTLRIQQELKFIHSFIQIALSANLCCSLPVRSRIWN